MSHAPKDSRGPTTLSQPERDWIAMVAHHAAKHVRAGLTPEEAIQRGIADHDAQFERIFASFVGRGTDYEPTTRAERRGAIESYIATRVYAEVRSEAGARMPTLAQVEDVIG